MSYDATSPPRGQGRASAGAVDGWMRQMGRRQAPAYAPDRQYREPPPVGEVIVRLAGEAGYNGDLIAAQIAHESAGWQSAIVRAKNNPSGLGAINSDPMGGAVTFDTPEAGIRATIAHLRTYVEGRANPWWADDPRAAAVPARNLGAVRVLADLDGRWAVPGQGYGAGIADLANQLVRFAEDQGGTMPAAPTQADIGYPTTVMWADADVGPARAVADVRWFIVHTTEGRRAGDLQVLARADPARASVHAWIGASGELVMIVPLDRVAWTSGNQAVDAVAVNVELEGRAAEPRSDAQYRALAAFFRWCRGQGMTGVPPEYVGRQERPGLIGHRDVANPTVPGQWGGASGHTDPGDGFDWARLVAEIAGGAVPAADPENRYFPETGHNLSHGFKRFWDENGGLPIFGLPLSEEFPGPAGFTVQWFERARFEYQPALAGNPWGVGLGRVGWERAVQCGYLDASGNPVHPAFQPIDDPGDGTWHPETQHTRRSGFRAYWDAFGGLALFGHPISEEFEENGRAVQYYERCRMEWVAGQWPERYDTTLGRLGAELTGR